MGHLRLSNETDDTSIYLKDIMALYILYMVHIQVFNVSKC